MTTDPQPAEGQCWAYTNSSGNVTEYWITFVSDEYVHLTNVETGEIIAPYPRSNFDVGMVVSKTLKSGWSYMTYSTSVCSRCERNLKMDNDYLCETCRYG